jgi:glycosyltransferase involved in cell wall biosynthesis
VFLEEPTRIAGPSSRDSKGPRERSLTFRQLIARIQGEGELTLVSEEHSDRPGVSVVIPFLNEEGNVSALMESIDTALKAAKRPFEVIAVDDGSTDNTFAELKKAFQKYDHLRVIRLRRNFGQTAALSAGIAHSKGTVIVTMDGDRQNDPADIPRMIDKLDEGFDIVSGWRKDRKEPLFSRRLPSRMANSLISRISRIKLHDYGCTLKVYRANVLSQVSLYGDVHRFIPALASSMGVKVAEMEVKHFPRVSGKSKYGFSRTYKVVLDLLTLKFMLSFSHRPILFFGLPGLLFGSVGVVLGIYAFILRMIVRVPISNRPLLTVVFPLCTILGIQMVSIGLFSEVLNRLYQETQKKPIYAIDERLEKDSDAFSVERHG